MRGRILLAAAALVAAAAPAATAGPIGSGNGTGIVDWLAVYKETGRGHSASGYCEYAVNADSTGTYGHFEAGVTAFTGSSVQPSTDASASSVSCAFYGTASGTFTLADSRSGGSAQKSRNQAAGRPYKICLSANVTWTDGDSVAINRCRWGIIRAELADLSVEVGQSEEGGTPEVVVTNETGSES